MNAPAPKVSFVSLGCPKALVDSERIITQLRAEGYEMTQASMTAPTWSSSTPAASSTAPRRSRWRRSARPWPRTARSSSPAAWAPSRSRSASSFPNVLAITGPQAYESVVAAVHEAAPPAHDPFIDLVPPQGVKLTPRHYAYLKISEGCNNRCSFCIIPKLRGDLVSRPVGDVLREAEKLAKAGVKELLVISQDTSAYGVDIKYQPSLWQDREVRTRFFDLATGTRRARHLGAHALRLPLPACRRGHPADGRGQDPALSRHSVPARLARAC